MKLNNVLTSLGNKFEGNNENVEREIYNQLFKSMKIKSKKRRIRNKAFKKAVSRMNETNNLSVEPLTNEVPTVSLTENNSVKVNSTLETKEEKVSLKGLSITFLLKLGKHYFRDEDVVRGYYKKEEPTYYKNKELLINTLEKQYSELPADIKTEASNMIKEELDRKTKK